MTDKDNGAPAEKPRIVIEFSGYKEADCAVTYTKDLTTGQLYSAAWVLDAVAHEYRAAETGQPQGRLVGAPADALEILRGMGIDVPGKPAHKAHG